MPDAASSPDFEAALAREVARVLGDPMFERSPVQSRLLRYLCEQTIGQNRNISQIAVAVDGLGRPENADQLTESYPRVQISRLRHNLSLYYSRCAPGEGMAVYIRRGDYQLRLAPPDRAYPRDRAFPPPSVANDTEDGASQGAGRRGSGGGSRHRPWLLLAAGALLLAAIAAGIAFYPQERKGLASPTLAISFAGDEQGDTPQAIAYRMAEDFAARSFVVSTVTGRAADRADYTLTIRSGTATSDEGGVALRVTNRDGEAIFRDSLPAQGDRAVIRARLHAKLAQIVGPTGVIASREVGGVSVPAKTDYECILALEYDRGQGRDVAGRALVCLEAFPGSSYRAYWLARSAFLAYRASVLEGGVASPSGPAWAELQRALDVDPYNPVANFVTAKVYIANGECSAARPYVERAVDGGNYYPTLVAAVNAEAGLCPGGAELLDALSTEVAEIAAATPNPDPLLRLYLVFATAALDRPDIARALLAFSANGRDAGILAPPLNTLREGLASSATFAENRVRIERVVESFYWGEQTRARLMEKLAVAAETAR